MHADRPPDHTRRHACTQCEARGAQLKEQVTDVGQVKGWSRGHLVLVSVALLCVHADRLGGLSADVLQRRGRVALKLQLIVHRAQLQLRELHALMHTLNLIIHLPQVDARKLHVLRNLSALFVEPRRLIVEPL